MMLIEVHRFIPLCGLHNSVQLKIDVNFELNSDSQQPKCRFFAVFLVSITYLKHIFDIWRPQAYPLEMMVALC